MSDIQTDACVYHGVEKRTQHDPAYRPMLAIVVVLSLGLGVIGFAAWGTLYAMLPEAALMGVIALLFLHSAYDIVRNARAELRPAT